MTDELTPEELSDLLSGFMPEIRGYRVLRRIGRGGMSFVYLGVQESLDRQVAIKVMAPEALRDEISKQRFEQEARTIAKLEHPNIVGIHEVGRTPQGLLFYVMPYLAKGHLGQRNVIDDEAEAIDVLRALLSALAYAHAHGIVHRDVKAENVLFDNANRPLLTDFGIALSKRDTTRLTTAGLAMGSGGYMAPEQARGEDVDGRADLYSIGVMAFELVTGQLPFQNPDALGLALMHAQNSVPRLPSEKSHWQPFIDRAMAKSPEHRFQSAQQMLTALNQVSSAREGTTAMSSLGAWLSQGLHAHWKPVVSLLAATIITAGLLLLWQSREPAKPEMDFFTLQDAAPTTQPPTPVAPELPTTQTPPAPTSGPTDPPAPAATDTPYAGMISDVTETRLAYDPSETGARELAAALRQIKAGQLSLPPGNNAIESLLAAWQIAPRMTGLQDAADQWLEAASRRLTDVIANHRDDVARALFTRAEQLAVTMERHDSPAWKMFRSNLNAPLKARIKQAIAAKDADALAASKQLAKSLAVPGKLLEPEWSLAITRPKPLPGSKLESGNSRLILVRLPTDNQPGLAIQPREVSKADYAAFVQDTQRAATRCRNRKAPITLKRRYWAAPGFEQASNHPVVCVSSHDALDYAAWLGKRDGVTYRLPHFAEWQSLVNYPGAADPCANGQLDCGKEGTRAADYGPASPLGLKGLKGNVREWLSDCAENCNKRQAAGLGWRDAPRNASATQHDDFDADVGFDDIGFRLVRDLRQNELQ